MLAAAVRAVLGLGRPYTASANGVLYSAKQVFSEENMKMTTAKFASLKPIRMHARQPAKKAAVLIPLCEVDGKVALLYTLRTVHLKSHRGQVSFPGGMQDIEDKTLEETALRETKEELGIGADRVHIWGSGNMIITRTSTCVLPVIGRIEGELKLDKLQVNRDEVEEVFAVPLDQLCRPDCLGYTQFRGSFSMPVFRGGPQRIWGLTALMTYMLLSSLLPQQAYSHRIKYVPPILDIKTRRAG